MRLTIYNTYPWILFGLILAISVDTAAADENSDTLRTKLVAAREKFVEVTQMEVVYNQKKELHDQLMSCKDKRSELISEIERMQIVLATYPPPRRMNNLQREDFLLCQRTKDELRAVEKDIRDYEAQAQRVDEAVLVQAEVQGKRPGLNHRRDILMAYPQAQQELYRTFRELKTAAQAAVGQSGRNIAEVIREANDELNESGEGDEKFGPYEPFHEALRQFYKKKGGKPKK